VISAARGGAYVDAMSALRPILTALLALALPAAAAAQSSSGLAEVPAEVRLLPGWRTADGTHMTALHVRLEPGWKTYWRAPGDGGIPPRFRWAGSQNLAGVRFHWPRPGVYEIGGMRSIGYYGELVLPMELTPVRPGEPIHLQAAVELGVCRDVCVPMSAEVTADLAASMAASAPDPRITAALAARPASAREADVRRVACTVEPLRDGLRLTARIEMPSLGPNEVAVFELPDDSIWVSESDNDREGRALVATSDMVPPSGAPFLLDRSTVRITVLAGDRAVEMQGCPAD
jgi:DsbC/DsbD-like thiol-disulfide interchange protein